MASRDEVLKRVRAALEIEPRINLHRYPIHVSLDDGVLTLDGDAQDIAAKRLAFALVHRIPGVGSVLDRLGVARTTARGDGEILDALSQSLLRELDLKNCSLRREEKGQVETLHEAVTDDASGDITFSAEDGVISLEGHVISLSHRRIAEVLAWWVPGCRLVHNRLTVRPPEEDNDGELADAIRLVLELDVLVHADQIGVNVVDRVVTLAGVVGRSDERHRAELDVWYVPGVHEVVNTLELAT